MPPLAIKRMVADVQQAVVTIRTFNPDMEPVGLGTGFFINDQGHVQSLDIELRSRRGDHWE